MKIYLVRHGQCDSNVVGRYNFIDEYTKQKVEEIRKIANEYIEKGTK